MGWCPVVSSFYSKKKPAGTVPAGFDFFMLLL